jgi:hypothetical protein
MRKLSGGLTATSFNLYTLVTAKTWRPFIMASRQTFQKPLLMQRSTTANIFRIKDLLCRSKHSTRLHQIWTVSEILVPCLELITPNGARDIEAGALQNSQVGETDLTPLHTRHLTNLVKRYFHP